MRPPVIGFREVLPRQDGSLRGWLVEDLVDKVQQFHQIVGY